MDIADSLIAAGNKLKAYNTRNEYSVREYKVPNQLPAFTKQTRHFKVTLQVNDIRFDYTDVKDKHVSHVTAAFLISVVK